MSVAIQAPADTITTEVIGRRFVAAGEQMFATLVRASYSPNIRERRDCSVGIFDRHGNLVALTAIGPIHLSSLAGVVANVLKRFPAAEIRAGDCFMTNDPYTGGGSHLPDITLISPVHHEGAIVAFVASLAHHSDIGGRVPGSESADCTSIFQEGLRIPVVRLVAGGAVQDDVLAFLLLNSRTPGEREGDIRAQLAANRTGVQRVQALVARFGAALVNDALQRLLDHAEMRTRQAIRSIPNGVYRAEQILDNDGLVNRDVWLVLTVTVEDERLVFDFTGTGDQVAGARNMPLTATLAAVYYAVKALLDPDLPANAGTWRCVEVIAPEGCVLHAVPPAAVGDRAATGNIVGDLIFAAMAGALPRGVMAGCGPYHGLIVSGRDPRTGAYFVDYETFAGAGGALYGMDGRDAVRVHVSGSANLPIESLEQEYPLAVLCYQLEPDSGGPGRWRGGLSTRRDILFLGEDMRLSGRGLRQVVGAFGLDGGRPGRTGAFELIEPDGRVETLAASFSERPVAAGSVIRVRTPSGGGYGLPSGRPAEALGDDVRSGKVTAAGALRDYGQIVTPEAAWSAADGDG